jgi:simple sugar transport system ATP-binding protein
VTAEIVLRVRNVSKRFGSVRANDDISLDLFKGEVLALLGENGAGKSTLMGILFGHHLPDSGSIEVFGRPLRPGSTRASLADGIGMVHQHFALADNLSVLENVIVGTQPRLSLTLRRKETRDKLLALMDRAGLHVDVDQIVGALSVGEKQRVEILKALYTGARILILDEPTAVLTPQESDQLMSSIRELAASGISVIYISHKLKEVVAVSDRVIILRSGRVVFEGVTLETSAPELAQRMVGRELPARKHARASAGAPVLELKQVDVVTSRVKVLSGADLVVGQGEIVGVVGVSGNGQQALFDVVTGMTSPSKGAVLLFGQPARGLTPSDFVARGVARVPEDRHATGVIVDLPIWENALAEEYRSSRFQKAGFVRRTQALASARELIRAFDIRCASERVVTKALSGGNLQKLILGRNLARKPRLIVASQPTRGLDIGAVSFVHDQLEEAKSAGCGILLISENIDELLALSDRLVVICHGELSAPIGQHEANVEQLGLMMMGQFRNVAE